MSATDDDLVRYAMEHRPFGGLTPAEHIRLAAFQDAHPDITIDHHAGEWYADVPMPAGSRYDSGHLHDPHLPALLDRLDQHLGKPDG